MNRKILIALVIIVIIRLFIFINVNVKDGRVVLVASITILGLFLINKIFKQSIFLYPAIVIFILITSGLYQPFKLDFNNNPVPVWITDEQRREHGVDYDNLFIVLIHNKVVNYTLSFIDHYFSYFQGDFLFTNGTYLYLIDALFIGVGFWMIIKSPTGWRLILVWLFAAPVVSALDFQPPTPLKAANMFVPLVSVSSFGALKVMSLILQLKRE